MDTPERTQIGTSLSKFEDSPVFNFINSLSPIKPVKSIHITQTFNSLSFASLPSVFTSPHVTSHKDSRFLRRHHFSDPSKSVGSSDEGNKVGKSDVGAAQLCDNTASVEPLNEPLKLANDLPQTLEYDCGSPDSNSTAYCGIEADSVLTLADTSTTLVPYHQEVPEKLMFEGEGSLRGICRIEQNKEGTECDWESLISDATGLLVFDSPNETEAFEGQIHKSQDQRKIIYCSNMLQFQEDDGNVLCKAQLAGPIDPPEQYKTEDPSTQPEDARELKDINQMLGGFASTSTWKCTANNPNEKMDNEPVSNLHRGMRRRCLFFETAGALRKKLNNSSSCSSSMLLQSNEEIASIDKQLVPIKPGGDSSRCILPGIGLHLNAIALTPKDLKVVKHETLATGGQLYMPNSTVFHSPSTGEESLNKLVISESSERDTKPPVNDIQVAEDASQASTDIASEDFNQGSPKKKRRKLEHSGENEACKRCNCKKSKCLKLYCECFAAGVYCIEPCSCQECFNKPVHEDTVLATRKQIESRNPLAFAPKVIRSSDSIPDIADESNQTPASARHKRGCNCKKSSCLKKYCECYQGGVGCSINCRCEGCKNAFGTKDGSVVLETEAEPDEEETEKSEKNVMEKGLQITLIQNNEEQNADSTLPATPLHLSRLSVQLPFSSKSKLQRSITVGSSSGLQSCQKLARTNFPRPQSKIEKIFPTIPEDDDIPEILRGNSTPISCIKSASPNSKRVSPPHCDFGSSPGRRSSRKLILQSIPSFPTLTPQP